MASPTPAASAASAVLLCREAWGARPARAGGRAHTITRMTIHHTAAVLGDNRNVTARLRQHQQYHQDQQGWIDIAYHVGVDRNGNIFELRTTDLAGDTATNYDPAGHFLVVCEGNFDQEEVTDAQLHGAALAFAWAAQKFGIATDVLAGHRDVSPDTACPGANLHAHVSSGASSAASTTYWPPAPWTSSTFVGPTRPQSSRTSRQAADRYGIGDACEG